MSFWNDNEYVVQAAKDKGLTLAEAVAEFIERWVWLDEKEDS